MASNPFSLVFDALWDLFETNTELTDLVRPGNRIKYNSTDNRDPVKAEVQDADMPEVILITDGFTSNLYHTSTSTSCKRSYAFVINTGDLRVNYRLNAVEWELFVAMLRWKDVLTSLTWNGLNFVKSVRMLTVSEGLSDNQQRLMRGWAALWRCEVEMHFKTADLLLETSSSSG